MEQYYDAMKKRKRDDALESAKQTAISAGEWGGAYGALDNLLSGERSFGRIAARGLGTGLGLAAIGGGASYLGNKLAGPPGEGDPAAYAKQGAIGGAAGGGTLGALGGYALGAGHLSGLSKLSPGIKSAASAAFPLDNLIVDRLKNQMAHPSHGRGLKTALLLGLLGAGIGGLKGFETGSEQDTKHNLAEEDHARAV